MEAGGTWNGRERDRRSGSLLVAARSTLCVGQRPIIPPLIELRRGLNARWIFISLPVLSLRAFHPSPMHPFNPSARHFRLVAAHGKKKLSRVKNVMKLENYVCSSFRANATNFRFLSTPFRALTSFRPPSSFSFDERGRIFLPNSSSRSLYAIFYKKKCVHCVKQLNCFACSFPNENIYFYEQI